MSNAHQINESHLGTEATVADAGRMAQILTAMGYPSEYSDAQGARTSMLDHETGEEIEIPDTVWMSALAQLSSDAEASMDDYDTAPERLADIKD